MSRLFVRSLWALTVLTGGSFLAGTLVTCTTPAKSTPDSATTAPSTQAAAAPCPLAPPQKGSTQLWAETCARCHNVRSPSAYSADQWQAIMHDMRIRGQLTGAEQRQILEFLRSAH